jgi:hypothetical protein
LTQRPGSLGNLSDPPEITILERITSTSQSARYRLRSQVIIATLRRASVMVSSIRGSV